MNTRKIYECEICGLEFGDQFKCEEHERSHIRDYSGADNKEIAKDLNQLSDSAYCYRFGSMVMGIPIQNFISLLTEASKRLLRTDNNEVSP